MHVQKGKVLRHIIYFTFLGGFVFVFFGGSDFFVVVVLFLLLNCLSILNIVLFHRSI